MSGRSPHDKEKASGRRRENTCRLVMASIRFGPGFHAIPFECPLGALQNKGRCTGLTPGILAQMPSWGPTYISQNCFTFQNKLNILQSGIYSIETRSVLTREEVKQTHV